MSLRSKRIRMHAENPRCHWCGGLTRLIDGLPLPDDAATIDHVYGRLNPERRLRTGAEHAIVLACNRCNQRRGRDDERRACGVTKRPRTFGTLADVAKVRAPYPKREPRDTFAERTILQREYAEALEVLQAALRRDVT